MHVYRPDREWLLAVRNGLLKDAELLALATEYETRLATLRATSTLPEASDVAQVEYWWWPCRNNTCRPHGSAARGV